MLAPEAPPAMKERTNGAEPYFLWSTNGAAHKNHANALEALRLYYNALGGTLDCWLTNLPPEAQQAVAPEHRRPERLQWMGRLSDSAYQEAMAGAEFLWHPARVDNGSFSVVEAAHAGVPSLSSDYPAMREMDHQFQLRLKWMDPDSPQDMARRLKEMEMRASEARAELPSAESLATQKVDRLAGAYWKVVRECL
jgi:glycosyltransferase involved in cell wall biosynthesis